MHISLVMTVIARDRPGLVDAIAAAIAEHDGNWLESRMSRLGGQFAGILRVELPESGKDALVDSLRALDASGLSVSVHQDTQPAALAGELRILEVVGHDRPGIVRQLSHALATHGVNVEEISSEVASAAMSGEPLFKARAKVMLPEGCDVESLQGELEQIATDLIVDLNFAKAD
jgi:glycine cleavage system regulatory protein